MKPDTAIALGRLAMQFGETNRATFHPDGTTPESDTTHTVMLTLITCQLCSELACLSHMDIGKVAQFSTVHDLLEADPETGDTNTFSPTPKLMEDKRRREALALGRLVSEFGRESWMIDQLLRYEAQEEPEARLVRYVDKMLPKITHLLNEGAAVRAMGYTSQDMQARHEAQVAKLSDEYSEFNGPVSDLMLSLMATAVSSYAAAPQPKAQEPRDESYPATPECDKALAGKEKYGLDAVGDFIGWCYAEKSWVLCEQTEHEVRPYTPVLISIENVFADYIGVDRAAMDREQRAILDHHIRVTQGSP